MIRVRFAVADGVAGNALYSWLRADSALLRTADVDTGPAAPGSMGALEVVEVVVGQLAALGSLAVSVAAWLDSRREPPAVTITRADGATLTIGSGVEVDAAVIEEFLSGDGGPE
ncbi:hypothetical protein [Actinoplanes sp. NPDC051859]|uniref:effector-associated constant component EACC1 n=1 Tax=Actinoplanes sp. NPDC051859 TaxID=3363909 RepID=UPI0037945015